MLSWSTDQLSLEGQELLNSIALEVYPFLIDKLANDLTSDELMSLDASMPLNAMQQLIQNNYAWVFKLDLSSDHANKRFWYRSEEKEEPRLGVRFKEPGWEKEMRLE